jgi:predicted amino acid dehydrogenase
VVICDISVPSDVSDSVARERPDIHIFRGGVVRLPLDPDFEIGGISLPRGHSLACMAETLLMGLEGADTHWSVGPVTASGVRQTMAAAERHEFRVADLTRKKTRIVNRFFDELRGRTSAPEPVGSGFWPALTLAGP